jgi:CRISPR-associated exonuclease Cas4
MHERVHNPYFTEKRRDLIVTREMPIFSRTLGISGKCDVVEFRRDDNGVELTGRRGLWLPCPVEYKRGEPKISDCDRLQLCGQALCLEEMLLCPPIDTAYLYYGQTKRREPVPLTEDLRRKFTDMTEEMHAYFKRHHTPRVKPTRGCNACSLRDLCLPRLPVKNSVSAYIDKYLRTQE